MSVSQEARGQMVPNVMTVLGPVPADQLGVVLPHEHLLVDLHWVSRIGDQFMKDVRLAIEEVLYFRNAGGSTVVEVTNLGLRRDPRGLRQIAQQSGLHIIMGCGWYREPFYDSSLYEQTTNQIADAMVRDILEEVDDTGVRAGIIG